MSAQLFPSFDPLVTTCIAVVWFLFIAIVTIALAIFVYHDATRRQRLALEIPPGLWACLALVFPGGGALAYWLVHDSVLARRDDTPPAA